MIALIDTEKKLWQNENCIPEKNPRMSGIGGNIPQHTKKYIWQTSSQHHLNGEKFEVIPFKSGMRQGFPLSPIPFSIGCSTC